MFDTHVHRAAPNYPQHVNTQITERRAPTDESVRLLREMEDKARDSVLFAIRCDANPFKFRAIVWDDMSTFTKMARINFALGEQEHDFEIELDRKLTHLTRENVMEEIKRAILERLASVLAINLTVEHFLK
jgi:hypothetical protein